jgi:osmotically-inducible protein OsmY
MSLFTDFQSVDTSVDIEEAARVRLQLSPYRAIRQCSCRFINGELHLHGKVPTYHYKQLAQVAVFGLSGVSAVINNIQVDAA